MKESDFQSKFGAWLKSERGSKTLALFGSSGVAMELKLSPEGRALPFKALAEHQEEALVRASEGTLYHKISDMGLGIKPFDCFVIRRGVGLVVAGWYSRGSLRAYLISIEAWKAERERCLDGGGKSLKEARASEIGEKVILLG